MDALPGDKSIKKIIWAFRERKSLEKNKMEAFSPDKGLKKKIRALFRPAMGPHRKTGLLSGGNELNINL
ncbi:MAG: hypothetical protein EGQ00_01985 [Parabacteroides johnsonii]|nr:hypothetical protein [Parabacteroides johnsonii]